MSDIVEEAIDSVIDYIESGEAWSYDDVVSEVYAQIQSIVEDYGYEMTSDEEDAMYEEVMSTLDAMQYIDHTKGVLTYKRDE